MRWRATECQPDQSMLKLNTLNTKYRYYLPLDLERVFFFQTYLCLQQWQAQPGRQKKVT